MVSIFILRLRARRDEGVAQTLMSSFTMILSDKIPAPNASSDARRR